MRYASVRGMYITHRARRGLCTACGRSSTLRGRGLGRLCDIVGHPAPMVPWKSRTMAEASGGQGTETGLSGVEVVLAKLQAGAKFGNSSYNAVGGLTAWAPPWSMPWAPRLDVEVDRDGKTHPHDLPPRSPLAYTRMPTRLIHLPIPPFKRTPQEPDPPGWKSSARYLPKPLVPCIRYWYDPGSSTKPPSSHTNSSSTACVRPASWCPGLKNHTIIIDENVAESRGD